MAHAPPDVLPTPVAELDVPLAPAVVQVLPSGVRRRHRLHERGRLCGARVRALRGRAALVGLDLPDAPRGGVDRLVRALA